jgi:hypothetical protein
MFKNGHRSSTDLPVWFLASPISFTRHRLHHVALKPFSLEDEISSFTNRLHAAQIFPTVPQCLWPLQAPRPRIAVRKMDARHTPASGILPPHHGPLSLRHDVQPSAKRPLHVRVVLVAVENFQIKGFVQSFKTLSTKKCLPISSRVTTAFCTLPCVDTTYRLPAIAIWARRGPLKTVWPMLWAGTIKRS